MAISFTCPNCKTETHVDEQFAGQSGPCRTCGQKITIPVPPGIAPAVSKASSASGLMVILLIAVIGLLVCGGGFFLLPTVGVTRHASTRMQCSNNLKQIALALHNYHDVYKTFPPAYTVNANGEPLHSWRTLILPFLEQQALYQRIDLNEPWNSPKNQAFNQIIIPTYHCPMSPGASDCSYVAVTGKNTVFQGSNPVKLGDIFDGLSNTILVVEVQSNPRSWMEPFDLDASKMTSVMNGSPNDPGSFHPGGMNVSFTDGAVKFIPQTIDKPTFEALLTIDGKETVTLP